MVGDTVIADGREYVIAWDGSLGQGQTVTPTSALRLCACGCGNPVSRPERRYASQACAGRGWRGVSTAERIRHQVGGA